MNGVVTCYDSLCLFFYDCIYIGKIIIVMLHTKF